MLIEVKVPGPGESVTEVEIGRWLVEDGKSVRKGEDIAEVESDKATLTLAAEVAGKLRITVAEGTAVPVGTVVCTIDTAEAPSGEDPESKTPEGATYTDAGTPDPVAAGAVKKLPEVPDENPRITSVGRKIMDEHGLSVDDLIKGLKRIGRREVEAVLTNNQAFPAAEKEVLREVTREVSRERISMLRRKLSERLVAVKNETAMLTTFNEVDMDKVIAIRKLYQDRFIAKYGFKLGFMSFFAKAVAMAAQSYPAVNSMIDGEEIVTPGYVDVGIAVQTPKGLMVPVVRNAESKSIPQIELEIKELAEKARNKKITVEELTGGTITITNGGVFGSLLSTPILNPPQSAILGMHNIVDRPVAVHGRVEIRPMMYIALSYDHRIVDGKDSVGFLVRVKELVENPEMMAAGGKDPVEVILGI